MHSLTVYHMLFSVLLAVLVVVVVGGSRWRSTEGGVLPGLVKPPIFTLNPPEASKLSQDVLQLRSPSLTVDDFTIEDGRRLQVSQTGAVNDQMPQYTQPLRELQQVGQITKVDTAARLKDAIDKGAEHIELESHMDLTDLDMIEGNSLLGTLPESIKSIRGNCNADAEFGGVPVKHAAMRELQPRQCLLIADHNVLEVWDSNLWLNNIYFRLTNPRSGTFDQIVLVTGPLAKVWMTDVTMQGNGDLVQDCIDCGVTVRAQGNMFVGDCIIADFDGFRVAYVGDGGKLAFTRTNFDTNVLFADNYGAAVIEADGAGGPAVRLQECTFSGKPPGDSLPQLLADNRGTESVAVFFSDSEIPAVCGYEGGDQVTTPPLCINNAPLPLEETAGGQFLSASSAWLVDVQELAIESHVEGSRMFRKFLHHITCIQDLMELGAEVYTSGSTSVQLHGPAADGDDDSKSPEELKEDHDVFSWEYVWVAVLVVAVLAGIGITALCLM